MDVISGLQRLPSNSIKGKRRTESEQFGKPLTPTEKNTGVFWRLELMFDICYCHREARGILEGRGIECVCSSDSEVRRV